MAFTNTSVGIHEISEGMPMYDHMMEYCTLRMSTHFGYDQQPDISQYLMDCSNHLGELQAPELIARAKQGDSDGLIELGLRYLSGCGVRQKSVEGALFVWDKLTDPRNSSSAGAPTEMVAQAHSSSAQAYFEKYQTPAEALPALLQDERRFKRTYGVGGSALQYLYMAAKHADASVTRGLVSPAVLLIGMHILDLGARTHIEIPQTPRFRVFRRLWKAVNDRQKEVYTEERRRQAKVAKAPNAYTCARVGCGIQAANKAAFSCCSGRCPLDLKPHYCSKQCQREDWPRHKPICKPGSGIPTNAVVLHDSSATLQLDTPGESFDEDNIVNEEEGPGCQVDVPGSDGRQWTIKSQNLSPEFLRHLRDTAVRHA
ncbi:hypothetical protein CERSUDRAFT_113225 [Gelatoporia subvermispora B]|uniref:MYND-type domain-containing protein n=1 Tax=Ceriporiopsis subvermispora (strain B) TaxID=914234 RepID=M2R0Q0_CERS8|nr:hypothetical protein CERSUDRAFT_113225 [Gelatoporia subvermispora B]